MRSSAARATNCSSVRGVSSKSTTISPAANSRVAYTPFPSRPPSPTRRPSTPGIVSTTPCDAAELLGARVDVATLDGLRPGLRREVLADLVRL